MATYLERDGKTILLGATDPEGDPLTVVAVNGSAALMNTNIPLSIGGSVYVTADGTVIFDDSGLTAPAPGSGVADSIIATVSDGTNSVSVAVNLQIHVPL